MIHSIYISFCLIFALFAQPMIAMDSDEASSIGLWSLVKKHPIASITVVVTTGVVIWGGSLWFKQEKEKRNQAPLNPEDVKPTDLLPKVENQTIVFINLFQELMDQKGCAPVHVAAAAGNIDSLKILLKENKKNATLEGPDRITPIMLASGNGHIQVTQLLLEQGGLPYPNIVDKKHMTALAYAAGNGQMQTTMLLVQYIKKNHKLGYITEQFFKRPTPLHCAINNGKYEVATYLLEQGANPASLDLQGQTPLHLAVKRKFNELFMEFLLSKCDTIHMLNREGLTPFDVARHDGNFEVELFLAGAGAKTALELAEDIVQQRREDALLEQILNKCDNNINLVRFGYTPLDLARLYKEEYPDAELVLLKAGAKTARELKEMGCTEKY